MSGIEELYASAVSNGLCENRLILAAGIAKGNGALFARLRQEWDETKASIAPTDSNYRLAIVARMQTMPEARRIILDHVADKAERNGWRLSPDALFALAWQAIALWLDPNCYHCDGRGHNPAKASDITEGAEVVEANRVSGLQIICKHCRGSKTRSPLVGRTAQAQALIDSALDNIRASVGHFRNQASNRKYARDDMERWIAEQTA